MTARRPSLPLVVLNSIKLCQNPRFQEYAGADNEQQAKAFICYTCKIKTRKALATDLEAFKRFSGLMERFSKWLAGNSKNG